MDIHLINSSFMRSLALTFDAGIYTPDIKYVKQISQEERDEVLFSDEWEVIEGIAIRSHGAPLRMLLWYESGSFVGNQIIVSDDCTLFSGKQGPVLASNAFTMYENRSGLAKDTIGKVAAYLDKHALDYRGLVLLDLFVEEKVEMMKRIYFGVPEEYLCAIKYMYGEMEAQALTRNNFIAGIKIFHPEGHGQLLSMLERIGDHSGITIEHGEDFVLVLSDGSRMFEAWRNLYMSIPPVFRGVGICWKIDGDRHSKYVYQVLKKGGRFGKIHRSGADGFYPRSDSLGVDSVPVLQTGDGEDCEQREGEISGGLQGLREDDPE